MSTTTTAATPNTLNSRVLQEGYGAEAWHGPNLKAALADVSSELASGGRPPAVTTSPRSRSTTPTTRIRSAAGCPRTRPSHSCWTAKTGSLFPGHMPSRGRTILTVVDTQQQRLAKLVSDIEAGRVHSRLSDSERFALVLGITCHAVYHAGQIQLIKKLHARD